MKKNLNQQMPEAFDLAIRLLARREHGAVELVNKLRHKGHSMSEAEDAVQRCQSLKMQCDGRYANAMLRTRHQQGYGPNWIKQELKAKHLSEDCIATAFDEEAIDWSSSALAVYQKKSKQVNPMDEKQKQKVMRYMQYRGFPLNIIQQVVSDIA